MNMDFETLRFTIDQHRQEIDRHQISVGNTFYWTTTIVLALAAGFFTLRASASWCDLTDSIRLCVGGAIAIVAVLISILAAQEMRTRIHASDANARVVVTASELLGLFSEARFSPQLYPELWKSWGDRNHPATKIAPRFGVFVLLIVAFGVATIVIIVSL